MKPTKMKSLYFKNGSGGPTFVLPEITAVSPIGNNPGHCPDANTSVIIRCTWRI